MNIIKKPALHFSEGRQDNDIVAIVVHWIVGTLEAADATFNSPNRQASAHYGIGDEEIHQYVNEEDTAWHCGDWLWNLKTIGIEHEGGPDLPISDMTYETSAKLIKDICERYNIPLDKDHILPHRKFVATQCPGTLDIDRLISLAGGENMDTPLKDRVIDWYDVEGKRHEVGWYVYEWGLEKSKVAAQAEEIRKKNKLIETQENLISSFELEDIKQEKRYSTLDIKHEALGKAYRALEGQFNSYRGSTEEDIKSLEAKLTDSEEKRLAAEKKVKEMSLWSFLKIKFGGGKI